MQKGTTRVDHFRGTMEVAKEGIQLLMATDRFV